MMQEWGAVIILFVIILGIVLDGMFERLEGDD